MNLNTAAIGNPNIAPE